jgi:hypothetical protein
MDPRGLAVGLLLALSLGLVVVACGEDRDRQALTDEELERELELAFDGDRALPTFEDTALVLEPAPPARELPPPPSPARTAPPRPAQPTQPTQPAPAQPRPAEPRVVTTTVPVGTSFAIRMEDELSTERSQAGDGFTATLAHPIMDASGTILVPAGATVRGRVTAVAPSTRVGETAAMKLAFEAITFGGQTYPLQATVERAEVRQVTRTSATEQAGKVAAGAAAGAILGQVIGRDRSSTIRGAAIGAAAGTAIAMGTADVDAVLPQGAEVVIRLDQPIHITRTVAG